MLTIIYPEAFRRGLKGAAQGPGFDGCFAHEQDGNRGKIDRLRRAAVTLL